MIRIGNKIIDTNIFLAPLSSCSDLAYRTIARKYGAKFCFFEMVDSRSLNYKSPRAFRILRTHAQDAPIAGQLLGADPEDMLRAADTMLKLAPITFLDINAACPAKKVVRKGAGSCFFSQAETLGTLLEFLTRRLPIPITIKMRVGLNKVDVESAVRMAKIAQDHGASALFVHGRSRSQENYGPVNYDAIAAVKKAVQVPVFGSGNILNPLLAKKMFDESGCDGILIAKGSFGNPFIYEEIRTYLESGKWTPNVDFGRKLQVLKEHLQLFREIEGERGEFRLGELGKICLWYLKGFTQATRVRGQIFNCKSQDELYSLIDNLQ